MLVDSILIVGVALLLSLGFTRLMIRCAPKLGLMDQPGERRIHAKAIPRAGGVGIWLAFMITMAVGLSSGLLHQTAQISWTWFSAFGAGSFILLVAGVIDDRKGLKPLVKLGAHALAPTVYYAIKPFSTGIFPPEFGWIWDFLLFVGWAVILINAFNLIDGLDGLCAGLAGVAALAMAGLAFINGSPGAAMVLLVMGAAIIGFLRYNINPAKIFLGDAGSMLLGFFLATAATEAVGRRAVLGVLLLPIAVAGVPLFDVLLAIWRRAARRFLRQLHGQGKSGGLFDADSDHLHHRLLASSGSQRKVAITLQGISILFAALALLPLLFGDRLLGLSLFGFLIIGLVGIRHLARVEIEHSGSVAHMVIKLPDRRRRKAVALFIYDLLALTAAGTLAVIIETNRLTRGDPWTDLTRFVVIFVILGSLATLASKIHMRLWARATMRDLYSLQFWMLAAALGTFALFSLAYSSMEWSGLRIALMSYVFASIGLSLPRVLLDLTRDLGLEARHRHARSGGHEDDHGPVVILGAGDLGTLFLDHLKSSPHEIYPGMQVLGFIDDTKALHGRHLRTFRVLGGFPIVLDLIEKSGLRGIVLAIQNPRAELMKELDNLTEEYGLRIYRWNVSLTPVTKPTLAAWPQAEISEKTRREPARVAKGA